MSVTKERGHDIKATESEHPKQAQQGQAAWDHMRRRNRLLLAIVVVLAAGLLAVGGLLISERSSESADLMGDFPTGTFEVDDVIWQFNEDGTGLGLVGDSEFEFPFKYAVNGDLFTETWFEWPEYEDSQLFPGTYFWTFDGENLTFELWGSDANANRRGLYTMSTFVKTD